ncbi:MAG: DUF6305 family protein [Bauldia sp.]
MLFNTFPIRRFMGAVALAMGLISAMGGFSTASAQAPKAAPPVLVTSIGRSLDSFQIQLVVRRLGVEFKHVADADADGLGNAKTLILAVGASLKGFGDAGITIKDELARTTKILDTAKAKGLYVILVHLGGEDRRDALSNQLIDLVGPRSNYMIIRDDSDADKMFTGISKTGNIPLVVIDGPDTLRPALEKIFAAG